MASDVTIERLAVSIPEAAELVGLSESVVRRLARNGEFPVKAVGGRLLVPVGALRAWLDDDGHHPRPSRSP